MDDRAVRLDGDTLLIRIGAAVTAYELTWLDPHPSVGHPALRLTKRAADGSPSETAYALIRRPWGWECTCGSFEFHTPKTHKPCKHIGALMAKGVIR